jgi:hypothetical protein
VTSVEGASAASRSEDWMRWMTVVGFSIGGEEKGGTVFGIHISPAVLGSWCRCFGPCLSSRWDLTNYRLGRLAGLAAAMASRGEGREVILRARPVWREGCTATSDKVAKLLGARPKSGKSVGTTAKVPFDGATSLRL